VPHLPAISCELSSAWLSRRPSQAARLSGCRCVHRHHSDSRAIRLTPPSRQIPLTNPPSAQYEAPTTQIPFTPAVVCSRAPNPRPGGLTEHNSAPIRAQSSTEYLDLCSIPAPSDHRLISNRAPKRSRFHAGPTPKRPAYKTPSHHPPIEPLLVSPDLETPCRPSSGPNPGLHLLHFSNEGSIFF